MALWSSATCAKHSTETGGLSLSPLSGQVANWKPVELTAIVTPDCIGSIPARGLANQATWTFFNQRTSKPENVKAHTENCS